MPGGETTHRRPPAPWPARRNVELTPQLEARTTEERGTKILTREGEPTVKSSDSPEAEKVTRAPAAREMTSRTWDENVNPIAATENGILPDDRGTGIAEVIMELHAGGLGGRVREEAGNGRSSSLLREGIRDKRASFGWRIRKDGPDMCLEFKSGVSVRGRAGHRAIDPAGNGVCCEGDSARLLRVVPRWASCVVNMGNDPDGCVRAWGRTEGVSVVGQRIVD